MTRGLGWFGILRLGLVQFSLGAVAALTTSTLNRVMVVEAALPAAVPAGLIAWHYLVQLTRPRWGHGSDGGGRRTPTIIAGVGVLALGALLATDAALMMRTAPLAGILAGLFGYTLVGVGMGAAGTSLLALLAAETSPERRPAAAALAWILMIFGIVASAAAMSALLRPFSPQRLALTASAIAATAFLLTLMAVFRMERASPTEVASRPRRSLREAIAEAMATPLLRRFTVFVFVSMLAYSAQELVLEPFAGLVFRLPPAGSAQITALMHGGALIGMILVGLLGARLGDRRGLVMRLWILAGCLGSAGALLALAGASLIGPPFPLAPVALLLGVANGVFTVAAVGSMMAAAGSGGGSQAGVRMGLFGAAQAIGFALGGFLGALGSDVLRGLLHEAPAAFALVFTLEAGLFLLAAALALRLDARAPAPAIPALALEGAHG